MVQHFVHYGLHFGAIAIIAYFFDKNNFKINYLILLATMLVDIDHLWANPIFDPNRCSIGFHTFHQPLFITFYVMGMFVFASKKIKLICIGLSFHMLTDYLDCHFESLIAAVFG
ncbi:MAG: DUF6122 family protein [Bacteroidota bacterium]